MLQMTRMELGRMGCRRPRSAERAVGERSDRGRRARRAAGVPDPELVERAEAAAVHGRVQAADPA